MQVPLETKAALWGTAGGAVALAIVGFIWGGWTTTSTADKLADERADSAVVAVLAPTCVEKFRQSWRCEMEPRSADKNLSKLGTRQFYGEGRLGQHAQELLLLTTFWLRPAPTSWSKPKVRPSDLKL
jgi:hypothetical protein